MSVTRLLKSDREHDYVEALKHIAYGRAHCKRDRCTTGRLPAVEAQQVARAVLVKYGVHWSPEGERADQLERAS